MANGRAVSTRIGFWLRGLVILGVLLAVALFPIPYTVFSTSPPRPVSDVVAVEGALRPLSGELLASAAGFRKATPALALWAWLDGSRDIQRLPDGAFQLQVTLTELQLDQSVMAAAMLGLRTAGREASVNSDGLRVLGVAARDPIARVLRPGDLLLEADGNPLVLPSDLEAIASRLEPGDTVTMLRRRDGVDESVRVPVHVTDDRRRFEATTVPIDPVLALPEGVVVRAVEEEAVGGSAGLMLALAIHDRFADEPLLRGRVVTGTGSISLDGTVHPIQGIRQKVIAAEAVGVEIFLAPASQFEEARAAAREMRVVSVATVDDAIAALRSDASG